MSYVFSFTFFSLPLIFTLHWWPLACLILSKISSSFFISRSRSLSPYFSLSFAGLPPTFSFSLSFSCSKFQICGHDNYSEVNNLENTDTETISAFRLFCCLCFTRCGWLCDFLSKKPRVAFGMPYLFIELFYIGMPVVRTDVRLVGRWVYGHVITKFPRMGSLPHFLTHGAPLRALRAREPRYYQFWSFVCSFLFIPAACGWEFHTVPYKRMSILSILRFLGLCAALNRMVRYQWQWSCMKLLSHFASVNRNRSWHSVIHDTIMILLLRHQVRAQEC